MGNIQGDDSLTKGDTSYLCKGKKCDQKDTEDGNDYSKCILQKTPHINTVSSTTASTTGRFHYHNYHFPLVLSTGAAYGNHFTTQQMLHALIENRKDDSSFDHEFANRVFNKCGYKAHSVALEDINDLFRRFSRSEYLQHRTSNLMRLAERAGNVALDRWGGPRNDITHLLWGTMTGGMNSPTIDVKLVGLLGLSSDVERTSIEGMGCLTGFRLLNLARSISEADPNARILVIAADLRAALGNSLPSKVTREDIVSIALFRDAASAAIVGGGKGVSLRPGERPCYELVTGLSRVVDDTHELVNYFEDDEGAIRLHLDRKLPDQIAMAEPDFVATLLGKGRQCLHEHVHNTDITLPCNGNDFDILCHTGGPRVLSEVAKSLDTDKKNMQWSWDVMLNHGNLSGASNLAVLDNHNSFDDTIQKRSKWAMGLSMGPGPCLEGVLLRCLHDKPTILETCANTSIPNSIVALPCEGRVSLASNEKRDMDAAAKFPDKKTIHIVGGGIAGMTLAAALDPTLFEVKVFEASSEISEKGYGIAIWPSALKILRDKMAVTGLDLFSADSMSLRVNRANHDIAFNGSTKDKGFIQRSNLLKCITKLVTERHPESILTNHRCQRLRFNKDGQVSVTYETLSASTPENTQSDIVTYTCDLLVGADGVNSSVRKYVALKTDSRFYGHMTAYRFLVPQPSDSLLKETESRWNISIGEKIHSPCYHISKDGGTLSVVVLEYDGKPPDHPREATFQELYDVAKRSELPFVMNILKNEEITDLMCYSSFHIDCEPWQHLSAVIIGDAAHAYGTLTAKMANLAINDAYTLAALLNDESKQAKSQNSILEEWERLQRPKFETTRIRTLRHLQFYAPGFVSKIIRVVWQIFPTQMLQYFGSIFAYDYEVHGEESNSNNKLRVSGIVGVTSADPVVPFVSYTLQIVFVLALSVLCVTYFEACRASHMHSILSAIYV